MATVQKMIHREGDEFVVNMKAIAKVYGKKFAESLTLGGLAALAELDDTFYAGHV